jgi:HEAT repeat protein
MTLRTRILFFATAWFIILLPFLFWRGTWFGRPLSDHQLQQYLRDEQKPRHIQHALVQIGERMARGDKRVDHWYPELVRLAAHPVEEIRNTAAWLMGQDNTRSEFRAALLKLLDDASPNVRYNAALSLVRFGDASGRREIATMLQPVEVASPVTGEVAALATPGDPIRQGGLVAKIVSDGRTVEVRAPVNGRIQHVTTHPSAPVSAAQTIAAITPASDQVWEALRALYLIGTEADLPSLRPYLQARADMPDRIRQQAVLTERAILRRAESEKQTTD